MAAFLAALALASYIAAPVLITLGWIKLATNPRPTYISSWCSLIAFILATASATLIVVGVGYSMAVGGFPHWDLKLMRFYAWGILTSFVALVVSIFGLAKKNALRWYAPGLALCLFIIWFAAAISE